MEVWELTAAEFVGYIVGGSAPAAPVGDWAGYEALAQQYAADPSSARRLTGVNAAYEIASVFGQPSWFLIHHATASGKQLVGFIDANFLAVDPSHGGHDLAEELILAAERARGVQRFKTRELNKKSEDAYIRAHRLAVHRAHSELEPVPAQVLAAYNLTKLYR